MGMYSLIVAVYKNAESLHELLAEIERIASSLDGPMEAVFVVDGSPDACYAILKDALPQRPLRSQLICHSRNFGSFAAIRTGLAHARGPYFAVMAADLQEPPELIVKFFRALAGNTCDIAVGVRASRADRFTSQLLSNLYWRFYRKLVIPDIPRGGVDVFGCNQKARDALGRLGESSSSLIGLLFWVGFRRELIPYRRLPRRHGKSAWGFARKFRYMSDSVFSFTDLPITLLTLTGALGIGASMSMAAVVLIGWYIGLIDVPGYAPTVLLISFFGALNMFGLGIIGTYVWRAFENTKGRPQSIVASQEEFGGT
jgi:glycosyltransferase involved in cell wall biosynthesis